MIKKIHKFVTPPETAVQNDRKPTKKNQKIKSGGRPKTKGGRFRVN